MAWYDDPNVVAQFPWPHRLFAGYCRMFVDRARGRIPGGSFLLRRLIDLGRWFGWNRPLCVVRGGTSIFLDLADPRFLWVIEEIGGPSAESALLQQLLRPGDTFLDVGANHGSFAVLASRIVGAEGLVLAFEPQPRLADLVRRSLEANHTSPFEVFPLGLGDRSETMEFFIPRSNSGASSLFRGVATAEKHDRLEVTVRRLDDVLSGRELPGRVMVKLDIEGAERAFLAGAKSTLERYRPILLFELNPSTAAAGGYSTVELLDELVALGYSKFAELDAYPETKVRSDLAVDVQRNLLAISELEPACHH